MKCHSGLAISSTMESYQKLYEFAFLGKVRREIVSSSKAER